MPSTQPNYFKILKKVFDNYHKEMAKAKVKSEADMKDDALAREKGSTPPLVEARKRVAATFCQQHFPADTTAARESRLAAIDYTQPLYPVNGRTANEQTAKAGILGLGRKPAYLVSEAYPPKTPDQPIYSLQYFPIKR